MLVGVFFINYTLANLYSNDGNAPVQVTLTNYPWHSLWTHNTLQRRLPWI